MLVDAEAYFANLLDALQQATRSILIIGWDFDAATRLNPNRSQTMGDLLGKLVENRSELEIRILIWNLAPVHAAGASLPLLLGQEWHDHPRIQLRLDNQHPIYGAQHQKIVSIDDSLGFVGGIDLTVGRWDTRAHLPSDPRRNKSDGQECAPVHDLQMAIDGEAAAALAQVARHRWNIATGEELRPVSQASEIWPSGLDPDFLNARVGIARTAPAWGKERQIREVEALTVDALAAARQAIYIEAQYFADSRIAPLLAKSLSLQTGPEIVVLVTQITHGLLEHWIMGANRDRMIRRLMRADRYDRFRAYHPVISGPDGECEILIHSKLMIIDDRLLRIGSSNLNRRSTGLDTECDLVIEAEDSTQRQRIVNIRDSLLAEHLGVSPPAVSATTLAEGSLINTIEALNGGPRRLSPFSSVTRRGPVHMIPGTRFLDPCRPFRLLSFLTGHRRKARRSIPAVSSD